MSLSFLRGHSLCLVKFILTFLPSCVRPSSILLSPLIFWRLPSIDCYSPFRNSKKSRTFLSLRSEKIFINFADARPTDSTFYLFFYLFFFVFLLYPLTFLDYGKQRCEIFENCSDSSRMSLRILLCVRTESTFCFFILFSLFDSVWSRREREDESKWEWDTVELSTRQSRRSAFGFDARYPRKTSSRCRLYKIQYR